MYHIVRNIRVIILNKFFSLTDIKSCLNAQFLRTFVVSFQLRSVDVNILYKAFEDIGFKHYIPTTCDCSDIESDDEILCFEDVYTKLVVFFNSIY